MGLELSGDHAMASSSVLSLPGEGGSLVYWPRSGLGLIYKQPISWRPIHSSTGYNTEQFQNIESIRLVIVGDRYYTYHFIPPEIRSDDNLSPGICIHYWGSHRYDSSLAD